MQACKSWQTCPPSGNVAELLQLNCLAYSKIATPDSEPVIHIMLSVSVANSKCIYEVCSWMLTVLT
eukprot:1319635-Amphidinium_carterae.1